MIIYLVFLTVSNGIHIACRMVIKLWHCHHPLCETAPPLGSSDHMHLGLHIMINGETRQHVSKTHTRRWVWYYARTNFDLASMLLFVI